METRVIIWNYVIASRVRGSEAIPHIEELPTLVGDCFGTNTLATTCNYFRKSYNTYPSPCIAMGYASSNFFSEGCLSNWPNAVTKK